MFKRFKYNVRFLNPARTFTGDISFEEGLTAIVGPNGKGKSLILELMQYAQFGSAALRGKADDYLDLRVELDWMVKGEKLSVERSASLVRLTGEGGPIATGTKPVNAAILRQFGYSYDVFKVANMSEQGEIEKLGSMKPTERKKLVDEVIGLSALDSLSDFIQKEITSENAAVNAMEAFVKPVVEPVKTEGLLLPADYSTQLVSLQEQGRTRAACNAIISRPNPKPEEEKEHSRAKELPELEAKEIERQAVLQQAIFFTNEMAKIPAYPSAEEEVKLHEKDDQYDSLTALLATRGSLQATINALSAEEVRIFPSGVTEETLVAEEAAGFLYNRWVNKQALMKTRVPHDCPKCQHHWDDEDPRIKGEFADVPDEEPPTALTAKSITVQRELLAKQPRKLELQGEIAKHQASLAATEDPTALITAIQSARKAYKEANEHRLNRKRYEELKKSLDMFSEHYNNATDNTGVISAIKEYARKVEAYNQALLNWGQRDAEIQVQRKLLALIPTDLDERIFETSNKLQQAHAYLNEVTAYEKLKKEQEELIVLLNQRKSDLADWKQGKVAVTDLRAKVKGYILPALNMVASSLVNEMTGGELSWIIINEEFEITVEGQRLETLSGAGKGVANLAIRLALGQVLTKAVFPVVMLDEIDGSFDDARAAYTATCLRRLTNVYKQVLQVSHKSGLEADHFIRL